MTIFAASCKTHVPKSTATVETSQVYRDGYAIRMNPELFHHIAESCEKNGQQGEIDGQICEFYKKFKNRNDELVTIKITKVDPRGKESATGTARMIRLYKFKYDQDTARHDAPFVEYNLYPSNDSMRVKTDLSQGARNISIKEIQHDFEDAMKALKITSTYN